MAVLLGIDGGGSRTTALVASGSKVLASASAGPSNVRTYGSDAASAAIESAIADALAKAQVQRDGIEAVAAGLAGISRPAEREPMEAWLDGAFPGVPIELVTDVELVLAAGSETEWGIAVVSGTGSIVFGRAVDGSTARAGGWGATVGDPGSGYAIGRAALIATAGVLDGLHARGRLTDLIVARTGVDSADALGAGHDPARIAELVPLVRDAAEGGDPVAAEILASAARELAAQVATVLRRLRWEGPVPFALGGGVILHVPVVRTSLLREIGLAGWSRAAVSLVEQPALGAIRLAKARLATAGAAR